MRFSIKARLHEQVWPRCFVGGLELSGWRPDLPDHQRELNFGVVELLGAFSLAELGRNGSRLDDLDAVVSDPVSRGHLSVHLLDSSV